MHLHETFVAAEDPDPAMARRIRRRLATAWKEREGTGAGSEPAVCEEIRTISLSAGPAGPLYAVDAGRQPRWHGAGSAGCTLARAALCRRRRAAQSDHRPWGRGFPGLPLFSLLPPEVCLRLSSDPRLYDSGPASGGRGIRSFRSCHLRRRELLLHRIKDSILHVSSAEEERAERHLHGWTSGVEPCRDSNGSVDEYPTKESARSGACPCGQLCGAS